MQRSFKDCSVTGPDKGYEEEETNKIIKKMVNFKLRSENEKNL